MNRGCTLARHQRLWTAGADLCGRCGTRLLNPWRWLERGLYAVLSIVAALLIWRQL